VTDGYLALILHAHLPFVRHPEHEYALEEDWFFESVLETYLPLLQNLENWRRDNLRVRLTITLSPTLCAMFRDTLLQERCLRHLDELLELAEKEVYRTHFQPRFNELAVFYRERFQAFRALYLSLGRDLVRGFGAYEDAGLLEIITTAATHAVLPLVQHGPSVRAQVMVARDFHRACFGRASRGIWLPECGYATGLEQTLHEAGLRWFVTDAHGLLHARPRPRFATFAPVLTATGVAAFGRDMESARQVWSRHEGYPGDPRYRDFYRDIGFDLESEYIKPHLVVPEKRAFTGIKYHRVGGPGEIYDRKEALEAARGHAAHFWESRIAQTHRAKELMQHPPVLVCPYDAELFGHWWYEGPEFLDALVRTACAGKDNLVLVSPDDYLEQHSRLQVATPASSSWGEGGYWRMWLNEQTEWVFRGLRPAQERMTGLVDSLAKPTPLQTRGLKQAGRELLLAQASDWPFILRTGTSPEYARNRVETHLSRFATLYDQLKKGRLREALLHEFEATDNLFPELDYRYWSAVPGVGSHREGP
jgi:1,4-alpha-glucan branching enzyme